MNNATLIIPVSQTPTRPVIRSLVLMLMLFIGSWMTVDAAELEGIRFNPTPEKIQVTLDVNQAQKYRIVQSAPGVLELALPKAKLPEAFQKTGLPMLEQEQIGVTANVRQQDDEVRVRLTRAHYVHLPFEIRVKVAPDQPLVVTQPLLPVSKPSFSAPRSTPTRMAQQFPQRQELLKAPRAIVATESKPVSSIQRPTRSVIQTPKSASKVFIAQNTPKKPVRIIAHAQQPKRPLLKSPTQPTPRKPASVLLAQAPKQPLKVYQAKPKQALKTHTQALTSEDPETDLSTELSENEINDPVNPAQAEEQLPALAQMDATPKVSTSQNNESNPISALEPPSPTRLKSHSFFSWALVGWIIGSLLFLVGTLVVCIGGFIFLRKTLLKPRQPAYVMTPNTLKKAQIQDEYQDPTSSRPSASGSASFQEALQDLNFGPPQQPVATAQAWEDRVEPASQSPWGYQQPRLDNPPWDQGTTEDDDLTEWDNLDSSQVDEDWETEPKPIMPQPVSQRSVPTFSQPTASFSIPPSGPKTPEQKTLTQPIFSQSTPIPRTSSLTQLFQSPPQQSASTSSQSPFTLASYNPKTLTAEASQNRLTEALNL